MKRVRVTLLMPYVCYLHHSTEEGMLYFIHTHPDMCPHIYTKIIISDNANSLEVFHFFFFYNKLQGKDGVPRDISEVGDFLHLDKHHNVSQYKFILNAQNLTLSVFFTPNSAY